MFGTSKVVLVVFLFSLINCTQGLSMFGLRNFKEGKKNLKGIAMKLLFNLLRLIHIVLPSSRQLNWRYGSARLQQSCKRYGTWYGTVSKRPKVWHLVRYSI